MVRDMTEGRPLKLILLFSLPLLFGNLFQQFYSMADTIIVGRFIDVNALASVGSTGALNFLIIGFVLGICSGFSIPIAQSFGAGDHKNLRRYVANTIWLALAFAAVLTTVVVALTRQILILTKTPADIFDGAYAYIVVIFAGIPATILYNVLSGILRALGDSKTPLYFLILSSILNIGLDLLFIIVFGMNVEGAAYATVISQGVSGVLCFFYMKKKFPILKLNREDLRPSLPHLRRLLGMGVPMGLQFSITAIGSTILQTAVNTLGSTIVASITAAVKVQMILTQVMETLGVTMATYCGQNLGAGKIRRIRRGVKTSLIAGILYSVAACLIASTVGSYAALLFIDSSEAAILSNVSHFLRINSLFYPMLTSLLILRNSLQGMGFSLPAMTAGIFEMAARSCVAFFLVGQFGFDAVCFANPSAWVAANVLLIPVYILAMRNLTRTCPEVEKFPAAK